MCFYILDNNIVTVQYSTCNFIKARENEYKKGISKITIRLPNKTIHYADFSEEK